MTDEDRRKPLVLKKWQRLAALIFGAIVYAGTAIYVLWDRQSIVAAAHCADAPANCQVLVSAVPNAAIVVAMVVVGSISLLLALTGMVPEFDVGGGTIAMSNMAEVVPPKDVAKAMVQASKEQLGVINSPAESAETRRQIYLSLPVDVRAAADTEWSNLFPKSLLVEQAREVRRGAGKGAHAWFINASSPAGESLWLRVTKGGRGLTGARAAESDEPDL